MPAFTLEITLISYKFSQNYIKSKMHSSLQLPSRPQHYYKHYYNNAYGSTFRRIKLIKIKIYNDNTIFIKYYNVHTKK